MLCDNAILALIPGPGLLFGLMLVAAIVGGYTARWLHVPRVVGFLLGGVALRFILLWVFEQTEEGDVEARLKSAAQPLQTIKDLALGLILFTIGGVFERQKLKATAAHVLRISALETTLVAAMVFVGCAVVALIARSGQTTGESVVLALLLGLAGIATAPAATLFVLQEYDAKGPVTDTILGLTGLNNIVCIVAFYTTFIVLASFGVIRTAGTLAEHLWLALAMTTAGSIALGIVGGTLISILHAKLPLPETLLFFFAFFILLGAGEKWLWEHRGVSYNFLLMALVMGGVFANVAIDWQRLATTLRTVSSPVFAAFFVMAGYSLHLKDLATMGWLGGAYVLCRIGAKVLGCRLGVQWTERPERVNGMLGASLLCQAAVVIGLASFVTNQWQSEAAHTFSMVVLGSVVIFELIGPLLVKHCVVNAGEVKAVSLMRRTGLDTEGGSIVRITLRSLGRLVGVGQPKTARTRDPSQMQVRHIMRTNVQLIRASSSFDDVLHLVERSTHSHFPVVDDDDKFVGVIHFADVRDVIYDPSLSDLVTAYDLADSESPAVPIDMPLNELLDLFTRENVAVVPVIEKSQAGRIVGLVEQRDLLRILRTTQQQGAGK